MMQHVQHPRYAAPQRLQMEQRFAPPVSSPEPVRHLEPERHEVRRATPQTVQQMVQALSPPTSRVGKVRPQQHRRIESPPPTTAMPPTTSKAKTLGQLSGLVRIVGDDGKIINPGPTYLYFQQQEQLQQQQLQQQQIQQRIQQNAQELKQQEQHQQQRDMERRKLEEQQPTMNNDATDLLQQAMCEIGMDEDMCADSPSQEPSQEPITTYVEDVGTVIHQPDRVIYAEPPQTTVQADMLDLQQLESTANTVTGARVPSPNVKYLPPGSSNENIMDGYQKRGMPTQPVQPQQRARALVQPQRKTPVPPEPQVLQQQIISEQQQIFIPTSDGQSRVMIVQGPPGAYTSEPQQIIQQQYIVGDRPTYSNINLQATCVPEKTRTPGVRPQGDRPTYSKLNPQATFVPETTRTPGVRPQSTGAPQAVYNIQPSSTPQPEISQSTPMQQATYQLPFQLSNQGMPVSSTSVLGTQQIAVTQQQQQIGVQPNIAITRPMYSALQPAPSNKAAPQQLYQTEQLNNEQTTHQVPRMYSVLQPPNTTEQPPSSSIRPMYSALQPPQGQTTSVIQTAESGTTYVCEQPTEGVTYALPGLLFLIFSKDE